MAEVRFSSHCHVPRALPRHCVAQTARRPARCTQDWASNSYGLAVLFLCANLLIFFGFTWFQFQKMLNMFDRLAQLRFWNCMVRFLTWSGIWSKCQIVSHSCMFSPKVGRKLGFHPCCNHVQQRMPPRLFPARRLVVHVRLHS